MKINKAVFNFVKIKNWFSYEKFRGYFCRETLGACKNIPKHLSKTDRALIFLLSCAIIISVFFIWRNYWIKTTNEVPAPGGTLTEGVVGEPKDLGKDLARLTNAGLTRLQPNGDIKGDLAESWQILDSGKTYEFKLRDGYSSQDLAAQIKAGNTWPNIEVATPADNLIDFKFKQPFSPFLYTSTEPVFSYGPYKIIKEDKTQITLAANSDYWQGQPNINKILIKLYPSDAALIKAAKSHEIMNYMVKDPSEWKNAGSSLFQMTLPRQLLLFFNLNNNDLKNKTLRQNLRDNKPADKDYTFNLATSDSPENLAAATKIQAEWAPFKVKINILKYDNITMQKDIIPNRKYDILIYTLDYGPDPDPYPFWHSSQIKPDGTNLSNYSNKTADKLLEDARQTFDFKIRDDKYNQFNQILADDVPYIKLSQASLNYVVGSDIKGLDKIFGFSETDRFLNMNQWYIKTKRVKK